MTPRQWIARQVHKIVAEHAEGCTVGELVEGILSRPRPPKASPRLVGQVVGECLQMGLIQTIGQDHAGAIMPKEKWKIVKGPTWAYLGGESGPGDTTQANEPAEGERRKDGEGKDDEALL